MQCDTTIFSVSSLNKTVKLLLENHFQIIWIEGEISNVSRPSSGHLYFTLKDQSAQVRCALFRLRFTNPNVIIENGMQILARAKISLYEGRGDYQLIIDHIEERGEGLLRRQFELLKNKLFAEGLFEVNFKQSLPRYPQKVGIITSPSGAALRDVLSVLKRRFAALPILIYPTLVQGEMAAQQIVKAIQVANERQECDILILCRGGGSLEDLWPFNEEAVARTIFKSEIPIVSGIGHETDVTIADWVADQRAPTPSAAAELISPDQADLTERIRFFNQRLASLVTTSLRQYAASLDSLEKRILHPNQRLQQHAQTLDFMEQQLVRAIKTKIELNRRQLEFSLLKLQHVNPAFRLPEQRTALANLSRNLSQLMSQVINDTKTKLTNSIRMLNTVSPLQTLERGFSITSNEKCVVDDITQVQVHDDLEIRVKNGVISCCVTSVSHRAR